MVWDKNKPQGSIKLRFLDDQCRDNFAALEDALSREHIFPGTEGVDAGKHKFISKGQIRGLEVSYKGADEVYISGGDIHINDGSADHLLVSDSQITRAITGHGQTSKPIYFYVDPPDSGNTIISADIEWNVDAPVWDHAKKGWYHPTNTDWRFIGSIPVDGSGNLIVGHRGRQGNWYQFDDPSAGPQPTSVLSSVSAATSFTDLTNLAKFVPHIDNAVAKLYAAAYGGAAGFSISLRKNGSSATGGVKMFDNPDPTNEAGGSGEIVVDSGGLAEYRSSSTGVTISMNCIGFWEPR